MIWLNLVRYPFVLIIFNYMASWNIRHSRHADFPMSFRTFPLPAIGSLELEGFYSLQTPMNINEL